MLPDADVLPDVLPTARLTRTGMPVPAVRAELRRIADVRNAVSVVALWAATVGLFVVTVAFHHPLVYLAAFLLMGTFFARFAILGHEAAHRLLFSRRRVNDVVGRWVLSFPAFVPFDLYRRSHFAHHREEFGPNEPDLNLYNGYPITRASFRRKLVRDAVGISGWKNLKPLLRSVLNPASRPVATRIVAAQAVLLAVCIAAGHWWLYPVLWLGPWLTVWRVINRLRAIAEHGGMTRSPDRRLTTHHVRQSRLARFCMVPYNTGWHLAHHVDMGVPWRNLPRLHAELVEAGWVIPGLEHPSYRAFWRHCASRPEAGTGVVDEAISTAPPTSGAVAEPSPAGLRSPVALDR
jgi:fatty acid desaturase